MIDRSKLASTLPPTQKHFRYFSTRRGATIVVDQWNMHYVVGSTAMFAFDQKNKASFLAALEAAKDEDTNE